MPTQLSVDPVLQNYAQDVARANTNRNADFLAPAVEVPTMHGRFWIHDKETPLKLPNTRRGVGGRATEVRFGEGKGRYDCEPHALDTPLDELEINEADQSGFGDIVRERADVIAWMGGLSHENDVIEEILAALGSGDAISFVDANDPIALLNDAYSDIIKSGLFGSMLGLRCLIGADAMLKLVSHPKILSRLPNGSRTKNGVQAASLEDVSSMLAFPVEFRVSTAVKDTKKEGETPVIDWLFSDDLIIFGAMQNPNRYDPSFAKTFRLRGQWMNLDMYEKEDGRGRVVKFDWNHDTKVANADAGARLVPSWTE